MQHQQTLKHIVSERGHDCRNMESANMLHAYFSGTHWKRTLSVIVQN